MAAHQMAHKRHVLSGDADIATLDAAIFDEPPSHKRGGIDPDGKADPLGWENHRRIHADDVTARRHQWPSRIPRVEGRIRLDDIIDEPSRLRPQRASEGAHHASGHGTLEPIGIPDSHHQLPDADGVGVAQTGRHQMRRVNTHHRDIGIGVITDQVSRLTAAIRQRHDELGGAIHDVAVGQNKAVGGKDKS